MHHQQQWQSPAPLGIAAGSPPSTPALHPNASITASPPDGSIWVPDGDSKVPSDKAMHSQEPVAG